MVKKEDAIKGLVAFFLFPYLFIWAGDFLSDIAVLCFFYHLFKDRIKCDFKSLNFTKHKKVIVVFLIAAFLFSVTEIVISEIGSVPDNQQELYKLSDDMNPVLYILMLTITGPLSEEIAFRFCIFSMFRKRFFKYGVSAVLFGMMHMVASFFADTVSIVPFLICSMVYILWGGLFAWIYEKTENVILCAILHGFYNLVPTLSLLALSLS